MNTILVVSSIIGFLAGAYMMYAAWEHNSQGEIHINGAVDWSYWLFIGLSWFVAIFLVSLGILTLVVRPWTTGSNTRK